MAWYEINKNENYSHFNPCGQSLAIPCGGRVVSLPLRAFPPTADIWKKDDRQAAFLSFTSVDFSVVQGQLVPSTMCTAPIGVKRGMSHRPFKMTLPVEPGRTVRLVPVLSANSTP